MQVFLRVLYNPSRKIQKMHVKLLFLIVKGIWYILKRISIILYLILASVTLILNINRRFYLDSTGLNYLSIYLSIYILKLSSISDFLYGKFILRILFSVFVKYMKKHILLRKRRMIFIN